MPGLARARSVVVIGAEGIARELAQTLTARGVPAHASNEPVAQLTLPEGPIAVVYLGGLRDDDPLAINREAFALARRCATQATAEGGLFVTVQDTGGDFGLSPAAGERAWFGGLAGLTKTAGLEWPAVGVRAIDLERGGRDPKALAAAVAGELLDGGEGVEVGLSASGRRVVLESVRAPAIPVAESPVNERSVLVCSGGARGVTASTLIALAMAHRCSIALLGRTALEGEPEACAGVDGDAALKRALLAAAQRAGERVSPAQLGKQVERILGMREIRATVAAIEAAGGRARYLAVDVTDAAGVASVLAEVRADWGPITGVVHGAGVVADKLIAEKTDAQFDRVFDTKVLGLQALLAATAQDPLDTLVLFSSVAGRSGNTGQCDYAMANEILNKVAGAERRRRPGLVVKSLGWGPWEAGMVTPSLKEYFASHGVPLIGLEAGARMLLDELRADPAAVEVVLGAPPQRNAIAGIAATEVCFDVLFRADRQPFLTDHRIEGTPVLPMTMALALCARAARALRPGQVVTACRDLKMYRGVVLDRFEVGHWLHLKATPLAPGGDHIRVELCDALRPEKRHYAAVVELAARSPEAPRPDAPLELGPFGAPIYDDLFHGPAFQILSAVEGVGERGIVGSIAGGNRDWGLTLDAGMQLAVLWTQYRLGGKALPTAIGSWTSFRPEPPEGPMRCSLVGRAEGAVAAVSDITFVDGGGRVVGRLDGVETHRRP